MKRIKARSSRIVALALMLGLSVVVLSLVLARPPASRAATTITVTSDADAGGTCPGAACTLRQAIATASPGDTINFAPGLTTVNLTTAELFINKNLIEMIALLALATTRSGEWVGLDGLKRWFRPRGTKA